MFFLKKYDYRQCYTLIAIFIENYHVFFMHGLSQLLELHDHFRQVHLQILLTEPLVVLI